MNSIDNHKESQLSSPAADDGRARGVGRQEEAPRRGFFLPVVLVLLVLSLIGNVYLYSQQLQQGKDEREAAGHRIISSGWELINTVQGLADTLDEFAQADSLESRMKAVEPLGGMTVAASSGMSNLIFAADGLAGREPLQDADKQAVHNFLHIVSSDPYAIGSHTGDLTEAEAAHVAALQETLAAIGSIAEQLNFPEVPTDMTAMQVAAGGAWGDVVYELVSVIREADIQSYAS